MTNVMIISDPPVVRSGKIRCPLHRPSPLCHTPISNRGGGNRQAGKDPRTANSREKANEPNRGTPRRPTKTHGGYWEARRCGRKTSALRIREGASKDHDPERPSERSRNSRQPRRGDRWGENRTASREAIRVGQNANSTDSRPTAKSTVNPSETQTHSKIIP